MPGWGGGLRELNGESDHIHLLIALPPNLDLSVFVNNQDHKFSAVT
jgi:REP element-mobilizing transposase RayT